jgi:methylmalonyl-CoA mutase, N-terminal domain
MAVDPILASGSDAELVSLANDAEVPIRRRYVDYRRGPEEALEAWARARTAAGPPFRPRYMVYSGLGSPRMTAERLRLLQELGAESFLLATDLPSQLGFDPDHELAHAQIGRAGVSCASLEDFHTICSELDLQAADSVGMLANSVGHVGLGMVSAVLEDRGARDVRLVMQNDPLKEFTARGTEIHEPEQAVRIACDGVGYAIDIDLPGIAMTVCSNHYDVAGSGPVTALAFAFANAITYVDELLDRGYALADVLSKMMFFLNERSDLFVGAAIFRTARILWSEILTERYGLALDDQPVMTLMGYAHGLETADEPLVNVPRCAISVAGAIMGGVDYLCAASYDEALRIPSADAAALSLRTMQVVATEHGVASTVDPLAGSAKFGDVNDHVATEVRAELGRIEEQGGALACLHNGYIARRIDESRGTRERQLATGDRTWVGANRLQAPAHRGRFQGSSTGEIDFHAIERDAVERLREGKRRRSPATVDRSLATLEKVAGSRDNLLPPTIEALRAGATVQELVAATGRGFGGGVMR